MNTEREPPFNGRNGFPPGDEGAESGQEGWGDDSMGGSFEEDADLSLGQADQASEGVQSSDLDETHDPFKETPRLAGHPGRASGIGGLQALINIEDSEGGGGVDDLLESLLGTPLEKQCRNKEDRGIKQELPLFTDFEKALRRYGFGAGSHNKFQKILEWVVVNFDMEQSYCCAQASVNCTVRYPGWPPQYSECVREVCGFLGVENLQVLNNNFTFHRFGLWREVAGNTLDQARVYGEILIRLFDRTRQASKRDPDVFQQGLERLARFVDGMNFAVFEDEEEKLFKPKTWGRKFRGLPIDLKMLDANIICFLKDRGHEVLASPAILIAKPFWDASDNKGLAVSKGASGQGAGATYQDSLAGSMDFKIRLFPYLPYKEPNAEGEHSIRIVRNDQFGVVVISGQEECGFEEIAGLLFCNLVKDQAGKTTLKIVALEELVPPGYLLLQSWRTDPENLSPKVGDVRDPFLQIPSDWFRDPKMLSVDFLNFLRMVVAVRKDLEVLSEEGMMAYLKSPFGRRKNASRVIEEGVAEYVGLLRDCGFELS